MTAAPTPLNARHPALAGLSEQAIIELAALARTVGSDPKTRRSFVNLRSQLDPKAPIPADVLVENLRDELAQKDQEKEIALAAQATKGRLEVQRAGLISSGRYTEEDVKGKLEPWMQENKIADYDQAATLFGALTAPEAGLQHDIASSGTWEMPPDFKDLVKDPVGISRRRAHQAMADIIRSRKAA